MPHYEAKSLDELIKALKTRQNAPVLSAPVSVPIENKTPMPSGQNRPKTWEEMQLEAMQKKR